MLVVINDVFIMFSVPVVLIHNNRKTRMVNQQTFIEGLWLYSKSVEHNNQSDRQNLHL